MSQTAIARDTNTIYLTGKVSVAPHFVYNQRGYGIYEGCIEVPRLSGTIDRVPFISESENIDWIKAGDYVSLDGFVHHRSKAKYPDAENRLVAYVTASRIASDSWQPENAVTLTGHLCKNPNFRVTPLGKSICELLIAVANGNGSQEYCFCMAWGNLARIASMLDVGAEIKGEGRFQSREYTKRLENGTTVKKTAYEISLSSIE